MSVILFHIIDNYCQKRFIEPFLSRCYFIITLQSEFICKRDGESGNGVVIVTISLRSILSTDASRVCNFVKREAPSQDPITHRLF